MHNNVANGKSVRFENSTGTKIPRTGPNSRTSRTIKKMGKVVRMKKAG